jgi:hypothetical protein
MRECSKCGFPFKVARYFEWRNDGTIISTDRANAQAQITFLELGDPGTGAPLLRDFRLTDENIKSV